ncbi:hypothetical protein [Serratia marcescens]|uniref:hypothetical protein n=1 Tax=Serratia marcescens TaxID=615 RepID=UPI001652D480|nr:hypothetical protein [Serratia marcescens]
MIKALRLQGTGRGQKFLLALYAALSLIDDVIPLRLPRHFQQPRQISDFAAGLTSDNNFSQHKEKLMAINNAQPTPPQRPAGV